MVFLRMLLYVMLALVIVACIFGLNVFFTRFMDKYARRIKQDGKSYSSKLEFDIGCLVVAGLFLSLIIFFPAVKKMFFLIMAMMFVIRSFYGKLSVPRGIALFFGSFLVSFFVNSVDNPMVKPILPVTFFILSIPLLILGFYKPRDYQKAGENSGEPKKKNKRKKGMQK
ncbi:MAG: hypothetical protein ABIH89_00755 [Elusimicrobiota bacterium]